MSADENQKSSPAVQRGVTYVTQGLEREYWSSSNHLPSLKALAKATGVSRDSMWKAIQILKSKGLVSAIERGRITAGAQAHHHAASARDTLWMKKRKAVEQDVLNGMFAAGKMLPALRELQSRYGASYAVIRKILDGLVKDRVLVPHKKSYMLPGAKKRYFQNTVVLFSERQTPNWLSVVTERMHKLVDALERECAQAEISIEYVDASVYDPGITRNTREQYRNDDKITGYLLNLWWIDSDEYRRRITDLLAELALHKKPIAILDEVGGFTLPEKLSGSQYIRVFRLAARTAGRDIGRMLTSLGHRRIAYVSIHHHHVWSHRRLQGLADRAASIGQEYSVVPITYDRIEHIYEAVFGACRLSAAEFRRLFSLGVTIEQAESYLREYEFARSKNLFAHCRPAAVGELQADLNILRHLADDIADIQYAVRMRDEAILAAQDKAYDLLLEPLLQQILDDPLITAVVAANDATALATIKFLRLNKKEVPDDISVVGFNNSQQAFEHGLTTFDFNMTGIAHRMLLHLLYHPGPAGASRNNTVEVEGVIIRRTSCGQDSRD